MLTLNLMELFCVQRIRQVIWKTMKPWPRQNNKEILGNFNLLKDLLMFKNIKRSQCELKETGWNLSYTSLWMLSRVTNVLRKVQQWNSARNGWYYASLECRNLVDISVKKLQQVPSHWSWTLASQVLNERYHDISVGKKTTLSRSPSRQIWNENTLTMATWL